MVTELHELSEYINNSLCGSQLRPSILRRNIDDTAWADQSPATTITRIDIIFYNNQQSLIHWSQMEW